MNEQQLKEEKLRKFKEMGIPTPMAPVDPSQMNKGVVNTAFAEKLAKIKGGASREKMEEFMAKENTSKSFSGSLPVPKPRGQQKANNGQKSEPTVKLAESHAQSDGGLASSLENALFGNVSQTPKANVNPSNPRQFSDNRLPDETGNMFLNEFRGKLNDRLTEKQKQASEFNSQIPAGHILVNEEELKEKITKISSEISKNMIKKVMAEFLVQQKNKKAELVNESTVKINGKLFKITPIQG